MLLNCQARQFISAPTWALAAASRVSNTPLPQSIWASPFTFEDRHRQSAQVA